MRHFALLILVSTLSGLAYGKTMVQSVKNCQADLNTIAATYEKIMDLGNANKLHENLSRNKPTINQQTTACRRPNSCGGLSKEGDERKLVVACARLIKLRGAINKYTASHALDSEKIQAISTELQKLKGTEGLKSVADEYGNKVIAALAPPPPAAAEEMAVAQVQEDTEVVQEIPVVTAPSVGNAEAPASAPASDQALAPQEFDAGASPDVVQVNGVTLSFQPLSRSGPRAN